MALKALDIAVFLLILSAGIVYIPPVAAPEWATAINTGPMNTLAVWNTANLNYLSNQWQAFTGVGTSLSILDLALFSLHILVEGFILAFMILALPIGAFFALAYTFPMIPVVLWTLVGIPIFCVYVWAIFQVLTGRPGEVLT
jgi:hypothetical protein